MGDREFQLVVDACRSVIGDPQSRANVETGAIDWERVSLLARRHRVQALVWEGLQLSGAAIPAKSTADLRSEAEHVLRANLQIALESARLLSTFQSAGVDLLFLKGLALGALAYRNPYLKMGWDIDLLVSPDQLDVSFSLLRSAGYQPVVPDAAGDAALATWHLTRKESVWQSDRGDFTIDLHSRLADNPGLLPKVGMNSSRQVARIENAVDLPTLGNDELFAYLCVHGASSAWFRLKWIVDLAALLADRDQAEIERLYERSQQFGAERAAAQALLLVDRLFAGNLGSRFRSRLEADKMNEFLVSAAINELKNPVEPTDRPLGTVMIHLTQLAIMPGASSAMGEAWRQLKTTLRLA